MFCIELCRLLRLLKKKKKKKKEFVIERINVVVICTLLTTAYTISYLTYLVLVLAGEFTVSNTQGHLSTRDKTPQCVCISTPMKPYFMAKTEITAYRGWHNSLPTVPNLVSGFYCLYCYNFGHSPHKPQLKDYVQGHPHKSLGRWLISPKFSPTKHFLFVCKTVDGKENIVLDHRPSGW